VIAEKCQWCGKEKVALPVPTGRKSLPVFVCIEAAGKSKVPCDGNVFLLATKKLP
jgi:hypothetical protein